VIPLTPPPAGRGNFPVEFVVTSAMEPRQLDAFAKQLCRGVRNGLFIFADSDLKFDQPQAEVVLIVTSFVHKELT